MVIIARNYEGKTISIVNAKSKELAMAYWQGKDIYPHTTKCVDDPEVYTPLNEHPTGVYPILETIEIVAGRCRDDAKLLCVK